MTQPLRVFIIEDSELLRERIIETLSDHPVLEVIGHADTEDDAFDKIRELRPEAVVVDIKLRQGNGLNVLRKMRQSNQPQPAPRVVIFSNYARGEYIRSAQALGADDILDKSTQFNRLPGVLASFAGGRVADENGSQGVAAS